MITKKTVTLRKGAFDDQLVVYIDERKYTPTTNSVYRLARLIEGMTPSSVDFGVGGIIVRYTFEQDKTVKRMFRQPIAKARLISLFKQNRSDTVALLHCYCEKGLNGKEYVIEIERMQNNHIRAYTVPEFLGGDNWEFLPNYDVSDVIYRIQQTLKYWDGYITAYHWVAQELEKKL